MITASLFNLGAMAIDTRQDLEFVLRANRPLRLVRARGRRIVCLAGCAWITAPGMRDDVILERNGSWDVTSDGLVLIEALGTATVRMAPAQSMVPST